MRQIHMWNQVSADGLFAAPDGGLDWAHYPFHAAVRGELELRRNNAIAVAAAHFREAHAAARNAAERRLLERRIASCHEPKFGMSVP